MGLKVFKTRMRFGNTERLVERGRFNEGPPVVAHHPLETRQSDRDHLDHSVLKWGLCKAYTKPIRLLVVFTCDVTTQTDGFFGHQRI